jgi:hypothetical protein
MWPTISNWASEDLVSKYAVPSGLLPPYGRDSTSFMAFVRLKLIWNAKALLLALGLGLATNVYAHPRVISATPAENEILASAPTNIRIEFTERPVAKFSGIELLDARNQAVLSVLRSC